MYLTTLLLLLLLLLLLVTHLHSPPPRWFRIPRLERGIDPHGPHPTDFDHDNGESVTFKEDSDFAVWVAAQSGLKKRNAQKDGTNIDVYFFLFSLTFWRSSARLIRDTNTASGRRKGARVMCEYRVGINIAERPRKDAVDGEYISTEMGHRDDVV
ncbi:hypothetical protein BDD12DRAFT_805633 [Trichophaea hybrida]|nr:hypothetical protein BDD12DRAFT_805633 [Trichophaea hybrida]